MQKWKGQLNWIYCIQEYVDEAKTVFYSDPNALGGKECRRKMQGSGIWGSLLSPRQLKGLGSDRCTLGWLDTLDRKLPTDV